MNGKVLITGATGFIGGALVKHLVTGGEWSVLAAVRDTSPRFAKDVELVCLGDLCGPVDFSQALRGVDVVVHCAALAALPPGGEPQMLQRVNVEATARLAQQAAEAGVRRLVFLSSVKALGERTPKGTRFLPDSTPAPEDAYGRSKLEAEQQLTEIGRTTGLEIVMIRPPLVYGPGVGGNFAALLKAVARGMPLPLGALRHNRRSLLGVDNLVNLIERCMTHPAAANRVVLASDGEDVSTTELLQRLACAMGRRARLIPVPAGLLVGLAAVLGRTATAQRLCDSLQVDITETQALLGWQPPVSLDEGLRRALGAMAEVRQG